MKLNTKNVKVSVIIPCYNNEKYIESAILSVLNQTYKNIEIIVIDDNSQDHTEKKVKSIMSDNLIYIKLNENVGASAAKNIGIEKSTGEYIAFLDSDDLYSKDKIEKQLNKFEIYADKNLGVVYCGIKLMNENSEFFREKIPNGKKWDEILNGEFMGATTLIKKECLEKIDLFDSNLQYFEDMDLYFRIYKQGYIFAHVESALYYYRKHETNVSNNRDLFISNIDKYYNKYLSMPEYKDNTKIKSQYYYMKGIALYRSNIIRSIYYMILAFASNPFYIWKKEANIIRYYLSYNLSEIFSR